MDIIPEVVIVMAQCTQGRGTFGIRLAATTRANWEATWAFPIDINAAKREGYDKQTVTGSFKLNDEYPGCPYCEQPSLCVCLCDGVFCWDGQKMKHHCPRCNQTITLGGEVDSLSVGGDL